MRESFMRVRPTAVPLTAPYLPVVAPTAEHRTTPAPAVRGLPGARTDQRRRNHPKPRPVPHPRRPFRPGGNR